MAVWMCRYHNGDISFGEANSKLAAQLFFDDEGDIRGADIRKVKHFGIHLVREQEGFSLQHFDEDFENWLEDNGININER